MNNSNLIPMDMRTEEEQREITRAGGIASGKARRRKKTLQALTRAAMAAPLNEFGRAQLKRSGVDLSALDPEDFTAAMSIVIGQIRAAAAGDPRAARLISDWMDNETERKRKRLENQKLQAEAAYISQKEDDDMVLQFVAGMVSASKDPERLPEWEATED